MHTLYILGGPNGAGKTTAAYTLLPDVFKTVEFVNADEIARGLSPFNPEGVAMQAGRIMLERISQLIREQKNFAFETTLSGLSYLRFLKHARSQGYSIVFFFVWLNSFELARHRVAARVIKGGHTIPSDVIERRYVKGMKNFPKYSALMDDWYVYDNSGKEYELVAKSIGGVKEIINFDVYNKIAGS